MSHTLTQIISGGQTGVDRGALEAGIVLGIRIGGYCPKDRLAEDGKVPEMYPMVELTTTTYPPRTKRNIAKSDATLVLYRGKMGRGTSLTVKTAKAQKKPCLVVDINLVRPEESGLLDWLVQHKVRTLNVAGSRESGDPGIQEASEVWLKAALS